MMPSNRLTVALIQRTTSESGDVWLSDNDGGRGNGRLLCRISPRTKRFYFKYIRQRHSTTIPLGRFSLTPMEGHITLSQAREDTHHLTALLLASPREDLRPVLLSSLRTQQAAFVSRLPRNVQAPSQAPSARTAPICKGPAEVCGSRPTTVTALCNAYADDLESRGSNDTARDARSIIRNYIAETDFGNRQANEITSSDVVAMLREVRAKKKSVDRANRVRWVVGAAYSNALASSMDSGADIDLGYFSLTFNPVAATKPMRPPKGDAPKMLMRTLDEDELGALWLDLTGAATSNRMSYRALRLDLMLGGQRCTQLLRAAVAHYDPACQTLTLFDGKGMRSTPRIHQLPLVGVAVQEVEWLLQHSQATNEPYLFTGDAPGQHLDAESVQDAVCSINKRLLKAGAVKVRFTYRDIRRTTETMMAGLGIPAEVRAHILSHDLSGVAERHYNRCQYTQQKLDALRQWQQHVLDCASAVARTRQQATPAAPKGR